jgi:hypothetical protein
VTSTGVDLTGAVTGTSFAGALNGTLGATTPSTVVATTVTINGSGASQSLDVQSSTGANAIRIKGRTSDGIGSFTFYDTTATTRYGLIQAAPTYFNIAAADTGAYLILSTTGTERMRIPSAGGVQAVTTISVGNATPSTSGAGITFPATQSASTDANTLDDYEEGTWTPVFQGSGGSIGSTAYSTRVGTYTKIGNVVTIGFTVVLSNKGSWSGDAYLSGLPFTSASNGIQNINSVWVDNVTFSTQINSRIPPNEALVAFRISTSGAAGSYLQVTGCANNSGFYGIAVYQV